MDKKMGPTEAALRSQREARGVANKRLMDKFKAKAVGKVTSVKAAKRGGRGR